MAEVVHGIPNKKPLEDGDIVSIDCGVLMNDFYGDQMPYTDSNYGNIFSLWDRLFGTYMNLDLEKIRYGIDDDYDDQNNFWNVIKRPFRKV